MRSYEDQQFTFQVGAGSRQGLNVKIHTMENMLFTTDQLRLDTREYAEETIGIVDHLLQNVQSEMGSLGAVQNRLDAASTNLVVLEENTTSAMSRIMDVDNAKEMMTQIKNSILEQAFIALQVHQLNNSESILSLISW